MPSSPRPRRLGRAAPALLLSLLLAAAGCSGDGERPPAGEDEHYIVQGNQLAQGDLRIGLMSVSEDEAVMEVYAEDFETETVRAGEGDTFEAGRRTITVERIETGGDEGVALTIDDPEAPAASASSEEDGGSPGEGGAEDGGPMEDPEVFSVRLGHQSTESGITIGLGATAGGTARMLVQTEDGGEEQVEAAAGEEFAAGDRTLEVVEVGDGIAYLKFTD
ncbi:hypothetical protein [Nocardiopsis potens]|uniref:hypothetical protein n=1 Tax=Nocardiopsis potens TaxID=1246458 RepID=UPI00034C59B9|nr:hypothetical protein [Nocardiopsis potens]